MIRIRGQFGPWPVDLEIDLDDTDWARLAGQLPVGAEPPAAAAAPAAKPAPSNEGRWAAAQALLREAGERSGPQLLAELAPLAGGTEAAKRLLVRLRHCPQVRIEQQGETALYRWVG